MTRKLWSINGLATEFGMDRRTVARLIRPLTPAGKLNGHDAWHLEDVAPYLSGTPRKPVPVPNFDPVVDMIEDRMEHWQAIKGLGGPKEYTVAEYCELTDTPPELALMRLRVGMPYRKEGDWKTGEGFTIESSYSLDWEMMLTRALYRAGRPDLARKLGIGGR